MKGRFDMYVKVAKEPGESLDFSGEPVRICDLSKRSSLYFLKSNCYLSRLVPSSGCSRIAVCRVKEEIVKRKQVRLSFCS